jgi:hypothetical protein
LGLKRSPKGRQAGGKMFVHTFLIGQILADTIDLRLLAPDRAWASGIRQNQHAIPGEEVPLYTRKLIAWR